MGLDMTLTKKTYIWNDEGKAKLDFSGTKYDHIKPERIKGIEEEIGYWRKANAIHAWFVENVQEGIDDCGEYEVEEEQLAELLGIVNKLLKELKTKKGKLVASSGVRNGQEYIDYIDGLVLANPELAEELLPTQSGFFFGNTEYNEYYLADLKDTKKILEEAINESQKGGYIYYNSSW